MLLEVLTLIYQVNKIKKFQSSTAYLTKKVKRVNDVLKIMASLLVKIKAVVCLVTDKHHGFLNNQTFVLIACPREKEKSAVYVPKIKD